MITRRTFFKYTGATALTLYATTSTGARVAIASIPGGTLDPGAIAKFVNPLLIPPVMPRKGTIPRPGGKNIDYYEIAVRQFTQQMLPAPMPATTVWGYGPAAGGPTSTALHHAPSFTIEAQAGVPVRVRWINDLVDAEGRFLPHLLPVDPTIHWANPERLPGEQGTRTDTQPFFTGRTYVKPEDYTDPSTQYTRYLGAVPMVVHLHGAHGVGDESDGYTEAWFLPAATNLGALAPHGTWYEYFADKALSRNGTKWAPGEAIAQYPNENRPSTLWFHDHALGLTRLNVYAGPAGFYLLRDHRGSDGDIRDARTGGRAFLPGPAPRRTDPPKGRRYHEIPLGIQDRSFNDDGSLFYPDSRTFFGELPEKWIPETDISPIWNPEFFGNAIIVNGHVWPFLDVEQRRYRFRALNGCQARFLILDFGEIPEVEVWQIGNEGGLLAAPVDVTGGLDGRLLMGPAERADLIVDFTRVPQGRWDLRNVGPDEPFGGGDFEPADADTTGQILQFRVVARTGADHSTPARHLVLPPVPALPDAASVRRLALLEKVSAQPGLDEPIEAQLGVVDASGRARPRDWDEHLTENPAHGACELWEIYNTTADAHPIHIHEVAFEVVDRQPLLTNEDDEVVQPMAVVSTPRSPEPWESGRKDTVVAYPGEVTRIRAQFLTAGRYVWHCHILEHEDNEMMRPLQVGPDQPGQPES